MLLTDQGEISGIVYYRKVGFGDNVNAKIFDFILINMS